MSAFERTFKVASRIVSYRMMTTRTSQSHPGYAVLLLALFRSLVVGAFAVLLSCSERRLDVSQFVGLASHRPHDADVADDHHRHRRDELARHQAVVVRQVRRAARQVIERTTHLHARMTNINQPTDQPTNQVIRQRSRHSNINSVHTHTRLTALCPGLDYPGEPVLER